MRSLWRESGRPLAPPVVLVLASSTLVVGLRLPVLTLRTGLAHERYSVLGGIADLARSGEILLAAIVLAFSVAFPIAKLAALGLVLFRPVEEERRARLVRWLELVGRWSMLDVFVVAILIGSVHLGILSEAEAEPGVHVFAAGILLSMLATIAVRTACSRLVILRWSRAPERFARPVLTLDKWAMLDVFGLALLVVVAKLGALASVETRIGFWVLLAAAALSMRDSLALRRSSERPSGS